MDRSISDVTWISAQGVDPTVVYWTLGVLVVSTAIIAYGTYCYQRWRRYQHFLTEMKTLDLDPDEEGTLAALVKRYNMDEPVNILYSQRLYDELASSEMVRILSSPGSADAKAAYIDALYEIRDKTYSHSWEIGVHAERKS